MRKNNERTNNKGFSLVELIIVIAIMAVLIGVMAPQFIKYVEQSRKSADIQAIDGLMTAMQTLSLEPAMNSDVATIVATITSGGIAYTATVRGTTIADTQVVAEMEKLLPTTSKLKSKEWGTTVVLTATVDIAGNVTYKSAHTGSTGSTVVTFKEYAPSMNITSSKTTS